MDTQIDLLVSQGLQAYQDKNYAGALKSFESSLAFREDDHAVREAAAYAANKAQAWSNAATHWLAIYRLNPRRMGVIDQYISALLQVGQYAAAKKFCETSETLQDNGNRPQYYFYMVKIHLSEGQVTRAAQIATTDFEQHKTDTTAMKYADCFLDHKQYSEVSGWIGAVTDKTPHRGAIDLLEARAFYARHWWDEAEQAWQKVAKKQPDNTNARLFLARIAANAGNQTLAETRYQAVLQDTPADGEAITFFIRAHFGSQNNAGALALIQNHWGSLDPVKRVGFLARARAASDPAAGVQVYRQELEKLPDSIALKLGYAGFLLDQKYIERANTEIRKYLQEFPDHFGLNKLCLRLMQMKSSPIYRQLQQAKFTLGLRPADVSLLNTVGGLLAQGNRRADAARHYMAAIKIVPDQAVLWRNGAYHIAMDNRLTEASDFAEQAIEALGTSSAQQYTNAAWVMQAAMKTGRALRFANKAIKLNPESVKAHELAADLQMAKGHYSRAWAHIQKIDQLAFPRRSEKLAHLGAQCIAAFRATSPTNGKIVHPVKGLFPEKLFHAIVNQSTPDDATGRKGIIVLSSSLGSGGAERQVAYVMQGMSGHSGPDEACSLVLDSLNPQTGNDFFLPEIEQTGCKTTSLETLRADSAIRQVLAKHPQYAEKVRQLAALPFDVSRVAIPFFAHLVKTRPRVVHLWQDSINIAGGMAAVAAGVPRIVLCTRSTRPAEISRFRRYLNEGYHALLGYRGYIKAINNSANGARDYEDWLGIPTGTIGVFYNGYDFDKIRGESKKGDRDRIRAQCTIPDGARVIGGVMRFSVEKRPDLWVDTLIRAIEISPDIHGLIVGDGPMRKALMDKVNALGLTGHIHFAGLQTPVEPWMSAMDMLFLSSITEGLPNVLIEAQSLGIPVATMNVGGAPEALDAGVSGITLEEAAPEVLAKQIVGTLEDPARMESMSKAAPAFVNSRFDLATMIANLREYYDSHI